LVLGTHLQLDTTGMTPSTEDHLLYLRLALELARKSPAKPTNFRVGALLVSYPNNNASSAEVLSTGYTLELEGNTHAEQCALAKLASQHSIAESELYKVLTSEANATLYTTLEPCSLRLSGNTPCVQRIIATRNPCRSVGGIRKVIFGAKEPGTFVKDSESCRIMFEAGIEWECVDGLTDEILAVAKEGHRQETDVENITEEERKRQEALPRNPKKRMMEVPIQR
jgi:pyrimidine deaminase RibD-like protein